MLKRTYIIKHPIQGFINTIIDGNITFCDEYPNAKLFTTIREAVKYLKTVKTGKPPFGLTNKEISEIVVIENYGLDTEEIVFSWFIGDDVRL